MRPDADVVVVGAGLVGLATARAVLAGRPGATVVVLDKEAAPARHQSGRNSGVVHSGLYYAPGSAKARLVADGRGLLLRWCAARSVPVRTLGKVVVATRARELAGLGALADRAAANGVEVRRLDPAGLRTVEPAVTGLAALHVPGAAVVDYRAVAAGLADELASWGAEVRTGAPVDAVDVDPGPGGGVVVHAGGAVVRARALVNCAGLQSDRLARACGAATDVSIVPFRGEYHDLRRPAADAVRGLVYPVPDPRWPFLGVHLTRAVDDHVHVGPNAVLALGREAYDRGWDRADLRALAADPGLRRLAVRAWRTGAVEVARSRSRRWLAAEVRRFLPGVGAGDLVPAPAGIRAQAVRADGTLVEDFEFATSPRCVHVLNAPSPAATACLAIGDVVARRLDGVLAG